MVNHPHEVAEISNENPTFWSSFSQTLIKNGIPRDKVRWYLNWALQFERETKGRLLVDRSAADVAAFLARLQSRPKVEPWQVRQASDALCLLYRNALKLTWAEEWPEIPAEESASGVDFPFGSGSAFPDIPRGKFSPEIESDLSRVSTEMRLLHYSLRTEESYLPWIRRYIAFHNGRSPREIGAPEVRTYLEFLAQERAVAGSTQKR